jgi:hypothetical protein
MKTPTAAQAMSILTVALEKGLDREQFQELIDEGHFTKIMNQKLRSGEGIKIHKLKATVQQDMDWRISVRLGGHSTPKVFNIWDSGDKYPPVSDKKEKRDYVLVNFSKGDGTWDKALKYAKDHDLELSNPREANSVASKKGLINELGIKDVKWIHVVSTTESHHRGNKHSCCVFISQENSNVFLHKTSSFSSKNSWFLFRKKIKPNI